MAAIDVGAEATDRAGNVNVFEYTMVGKENAANDTGTLTSAESFFAVDGGTEDVWIGTFSASGNVLTCRDSESVGTITIGSKLTHSGLDITVSAGDYIGVYDKAGTNTGIERDDSGDGYWYYNGECIDASDSQTFTWGADRTISLKGIGETAAGQDYPKSASVSLGTALSVSRVASFPRTASPSLGTGLSVSRSVATSRSSSNTLGLAPTASRLWGVVRTSSVTLGLASTASRIITTSRSASHTLGLSSAVSRALALARSTTNTLGTGLTVSRALAIARTATNQLGLSTSASRLWDVVKSASVSIGLYTLATPYLKFKRRIGLIGTQRTVETVGSEREVTQVGERRDY